MTAPVTQLLCNQRVASSKEHQLHFIIYTEALPIFSFESRTREDHVLARGEAPFDLLAQTFQPRPSIFIGKRMTAAHLLNICSGMKIIRFKKMPAEFAREQLPDCGFAGAGNTENNYDHNALFWLQLPIFSTTNVITTNSV